MREILYIARLAAMDNQKVGASDAPASVTRKRFLRDWAVEHQVVLVSALIGAIGLIVAAVITAAPALIKPTVETKFEDDYVLNYSYFNVLLDEFQPLKETEVDGDDRSMVSVARIDSILKNKDGHNDYTLPYYTNGKRIEVSSLKASVKVNFNEMSSLDEAYRHSYELRLAIKDKPVGHTEIMQSRFRFINGFRNPKEEWWSASIKYPTKAVGVHIGCPKTKPCKSARVFRRKGISEKVEILDNPTFLSEDGLHIVWMSNDEKPDTRILFQWEW